MKNYIIDSYSLITYFEKDKGYKKVIDLFDKASSEGIKFMMNIINWGEVYYITLREKGYERSKKFENNFKILPIELTYLDIELIKKAAEFKAFNSLSYADCIAAATASNYKGILVTGDKEFSQLEKNITIEWI
ncbi:type II toxin-antitoxin system VapC family toxin [bacterium]|nr:type II toxin-antitoxin system VapC family toxin [bacterium]